MFVTLKVFKLIGPSNDGRRHGRGTYLFLMDCNPQSDPKINARCNPTQDWKRIERSLNENNKSSKRRDFPIVAATQPRITTKKRSIIENNINPVAYLKMIQHLTAAKL
jgi:hypothetical protein